jgi:hypothetical protein
MASKVKETIVNRIKCVKYFAILLDCTRDSGRVEQMTFILTYVDTVTGLQYYSAGLQTVLKEAPEFEGNRKYDISLRFREKRTTRRKSIFDYENGDEPRKQFQNRILLRNGK